MLIPIGDNLQKRSLPFVGLTIIVFNLLVGLYELRLWREGIPKHASTHYSAYDEYGMYDESAVTLPVSVPLMNFVKEWGLIPFDVPDGEWHRFITHTFLHGDIWHLVGNLMTLWLFLPSLEAGLGGFRFGLMYVLAGIAGGVAHWLMFPNDTTPMIGASGAISGMVGAYFVAFGALAKLKLAWNGGLMTGWRWVTFSIPAGVYVFFWIIVPQVAAVEFAMSTGDHMGVAWFAHGGGFAMGVVFMGISRNDVLGRLHVNLEGELEIRDTEKAVRVREATVPAPDVVACTYCTTPLSAGIDMAPGLIRCGNPTCGRLNIVDPSVQAATCDQEDLMASSAD